MKCAGILKTGKPCRYPAKKGNFCGVHAPKGEEKKEDPIFTLTFGGQAENNVGMQKLGKIRDEGFTMTELRSFRDLLEKMGLKPDLIDLREALEGTDHHENAPEAGILVIPSGITHILKMEGMTMEDLTNEMSIIKWDTKAFMRGKVKNKRARHNVCFSEEGQEPDYEDKKGRVVAFRDAPGTNAIRKQLSLLFGKKADLLMAEGNKYYDPRCTGIGYHGDAERKIVIAGRVGGPFPLMYQWYYRFKRIGGKVTINLNSGDMYIMSEKAVGTDWKRSSILTLRHAAGSKKYID